MLTVCEVLVLRCDQGASIDSTRRDSLVHRVVRLDWYNSMVEQMCGGATSYSGEDAQRTICPNPHSGVTENPLSL